MIARQITATIKKDLTQKMVLLAGPRQCGKTSLAKSLVKAAKGAYFNWPLDPKRCGKTLSC